MFVVISTKVCVGDLLYDVLVNRKKNENALIKQLLKNTKISWVITPS